jgi:phosphate transport system permease protein
MVARGFGTAAVLILLVLALFIVARMIGGRGPGILSDRQRRAAKAESIRDLQRITMLDDRIATGRYPPAPKRSAPIASSTPADSPTTPEEPA